MAQQMADMATEIDAAKNAVVEMEATDGEITHSESRHGLNGRHTFKYTDCVHAHRLADGWMFVGFGSGWFAIERADD